MDEAFACHLCRLRQSHDVEDGRCHIGQDSVLHGCILVLSHINEWNRVERVGCVRSSVWVDGVVSISVVCDDDDLVTHLLSSLHHVVHTEVDGIDSFLDGFVNTGVSHHVTIGEVHHDEVELIFFNAGHQLVFHFKSRHLRLEVVSRNFWRGHQCALFAIVRHFSSTVEEECDVCIFLCLCGVELLQTFRCEIFSQRVLHVFFRKEDVHTGERCVVRGHAVVLQSWDGVHSLLRHVLLCEGNSEFLGAVVAVIEEDNHIAFLDSSIHIGIDDWLHELVCVLVVLRVGVIARLHAFNHIAHLASLAIYELVVSHFQTFPSLVAVHGIEAADDAGDMSGGLVAVLLQLCDEAFAALRVGVASIHEAMYEGVAHSVFLGDIDEFEEVLQRRVHATIGGKPHQVDALSVVPCIFVGAHNLRILHDGVVAACAVDFHEVLIDDTSGTDIEVSHLRVSHLSVRQSDVLARCLELRVGICAVEIIHVRSRFLIDDVALTFVSDSPSVENHE